jgi:MSHA biogenesis protein MshJ
MNDIRKRLQAWWDKRSAREGLAIYLGGFLILYLIIYIIIFRPSGIHKKELEQQIASLKQQQIDIKQKIFALQEMTQSTLFIQMNAEQKRLIKRIEQLQKRLNNLKPAIFLMDDLPKITKKILSERLSQIKLINLEQLPVETWPAPDAPVKALLPSTLSGRQHAIQMEFQSDFFSTMHYLKRIEKLSPYVYWDSMDYKVSQYPTADVTIQFHVLSL